MINEFIIYILFPASVIASMGLVWIRGKGPADTIEAEAIVLSLSFTKEQGKNVPQAVLQLQVNPTRGKNFVVEIREILSGSDLYFARCGEKIVVNYDPAKPKRIRIDRKRSVQDLKEEQLLIEF